MFLCRYCPSVWESWGGHFEEWVMFDVVQKKVLSMLDEGDDSKGNNDRSNENGSSGGIEGYTWSSLITLYCRGWLAVRQVQKGRIQGNSPASLDQTELRKYLRGACKIKSLAAWCWRERTCSLQKLPLPQWHSQSVFAYSFFDDTWAATAAPSTPKEFKKKRIGKGEEAIKALENALVDCWNELSDSLFEQGADSMPYRVAAVIKAKGTKY